MNYAESRRGYGNMWAKAKLKPERRAATQNVARRLNSNRARYEGAGAVTKTPWWWIAITHNLEASGSFGGHLHNGDPLTARTTHVPAGRPKTGSPPFTWEYSAEDALVMHDLHKVTSWELPRCLYEWERFNGFGYVARKVNSPYVWSFTDQYARGKYVADSKFDPFAVSQQCGAAATLMALVELNLAVIPAPVVTPEQAPAIDFDRSAPPVVKSPVATKTPEWDVIGWAINMLKGLFQ